MRNVNTIIGLKVLHLINASVNKIYHTLIDSYDNIAFKVDEIQESLSTMTNDLK